jgi:hypothetical protein
MNRLRILAEILNVLHKFPDREIVALYEAVQKEIETTELNITSPLPIPPVTM